MSIRLDWQQDLEQDDWPDPSEGPPHRTRRLGWRWLLLGCVALITAAIVTVGRLSDQGSRADIADLQESLAFAHWALQQQDQELFKTALDASYPAWQATVLSDWDYHAKTARNGQPPQVETFTLNYDRIEASLQWHDEANGRSFVTWRWFRLALPDPRAPAGRPDWRWTQPTSDTFGPEKVVSRPHLTLTYDERDAAVAAHMVDQLDAATGALCARFGVDPDNCHFHMRWDVLDPAGQPLSLRDLALPPLAEVVSPELTGPMFIMNGTVDDWHSARMRQRLLRFFPGRGFIAQSRLAILRPESQKRLPTAQPGDESHPIVAPTPWLYGVDSQGQPHPAWVTHIQRLVADAVMRRAEGFILGSADYVNAVWALHQAILAAETDLPAQNRLATPGPAAPFDSTRATLADLSSLGVALQTQPDGQTLARLADLSRFMRSAWSQEQVAALPAALGSTASMDRALNQALGVDGGAFIRDWRLGSQWSVRTEH